MANRIPLIVDATPLASIKELPIGDNLDLTGSGIYAVRNIIPETDSTYSLGSESKKWKDLWISGSSIHIGGATISFDPAGGGGGTGSFSFNTGGGSPSTDSFATLTGTETLTNKTLTSPVVTTSLTTGSTSFDLLNDTATTVNFAGAATVISIGASTGGTNSRGGVTTINNDLTVTGNLDVKGTVSFIESTTVQVADKNLELGKVETPTDITADGAGISVLGDTTKTFNWVKDTAAWTSSEKLSHKGLVPTSGTEIDQITTITKSLTLSTDWQDTGISHTDLATGTYLIQLFANDSGAGGTNSNEYYSGTMSWYAGATNSSAELPTDEIQLHRAGASGDAGLYLRTYRSATIDGTNLKLQIYSNSDNPSASNYVFKFRRMM
jgi:hypothetical protein